jgi:photosystem II stability/assembly factor-like uncharacterized protein
MKKYTLIYILLVVSIKLTCQVNFQNFAADFPTNYNYEVVWADANTVYSVGSYFEFGGSYSSTGYIYKSTNNGNGFRTVRQKADANYKGVWFLNKDIGFVCGWEANKAVILKTTDGGTTWTSQVLLGSTSSEDIYFINNTTGFVACGSVIYKTLDGGETWVKSNNEGYNVVKIQFVTEQKGYALMGEGLLLVTDNQGASWQKLTIDAQYSPNDNPLYAYSMHWLNEKVGLIGTGRGVFYKTYDGGNNWKIISLRNNTSDDINDIKFLTSTLGYATGYGSDNFVFKTKDGGETWESIYTNARINPFTHLAIGKDGLNATAIVTGFNAFFKTDNINPDLDGARPFASLQGNGSTCGNENVNLQLDITGDNPPYTVTYSNNGNLVTVNNITTTPYFIKVQPQNNNLNTYELKSIKNDAGTTGYATGKAEIYKNLPSRAVLKDIKQVVCRKDTLILPITLSGCAPWKLEYTEGGTTFTQSNITNPNFNLKVLPTKTGVFTLKSVTDASGIVSTNVSGKAELTVDTAKVKITNYDSVNEVCPGAEREISLSFSGQPPFNLYYTIGKDNFKIENIPNTYYYLKVKVDSAPVVITRITNFCGDGSIENGVARFNVRPYKSFPTDVKFQIIDNKRDKVFITWTGNAPNSTSFNLEMSRFNAQSFVSISSFAGYGQQSFTQNIYDESTYYFRFSQYNGYCSVFSPIDSFSLKPFFEKQKLTDYRNDFKTYIDFNNDGCQDLILDASIYKGDGKYNFEIVSPLEKVQNAFGGSIVADYDNDGYEDVLKYSRDEMSLHRNYKNGEFRLVKRWFPYDRGAFVRFMDIDNDGDVDIYSGGSYAFRNDGDAVFTPLSISGLETFDNYEPIVMDVNNDLKPDIVYAYYADTLLMFLNKGNFEFTRVAQYSRSFGISAAKPSVRDVNNDGWDDITFGALGYYINQKNNNFEKLNTSTEGVGTVFYGDLDNNGYLDGNSNYLGGSNGVNLYQSENNFELISNFLEGLTEAKQLTDLNNDGYLDAVVPSVFGQIYIAKNTKFSNKNGINIKCVGTKSNRSAIGALVCVKARVEGQNFVRYQRVTSGVLHFGVGNATVIDSVIVFFPSGIVVKKANLAPNQRYVVSEEPLPVPPAPIALSAFSYNTKRVDLKWRLNTKDYAGIIVERSLNAVSGFMPVDTVFDYSNVSKDSSVVSGTYYYYRVRAFNTGVFSDYSNVVGVRVFTNCSLGIKLLTPSVSEVKFGDFVLLQATTGENISYRWYNYDLNGVIGNENDTTATFKAIVAGKYAAIAIKNNDCIDTTNQIEVRLKNPFTLDFQNPLYINFTGSYWADYDKDGDDDVLVSGVKLYRNDGDFKFTDITATAFPTDTLNSTALASWGDYDNDGFADIYLTTNSNYNGVGKNILYKNKGDGTFKKITDNACVDKIYIHSTSTWFDANNDGLLDVLSASSDNTSIYLNKGNGIFEASDKLVRTEYASIGILDFENDGLLDILMIQRDSFTNYEDKLILYKNKGAGKFDKKDLKLLDDYYNHYSPTRYFGRGSRNSPNIVDIDNDGLLDIYVPKLTATQSALMNKGNGVYEITPLEGIILTNDDLNKAVLWIDVDNNGWLDYYVNGRFFMNYGQGKFVYSPVFSLDYVTIKSGITGVDMNNDGFVDILQAVEIDYNREFSSRYKSFLLKNQANSNNWLTVKPLATVSNRLALGTIFKIKATINGKKVAMARTIQGQTGYLSQSAQKANFGLGDATIIDSLIVQFPSGITRRFANITSNQIIEISEDVNVIPSLPLTVVGKDTCLNKVTIDLTVSGGKTPYKYLWNTGASTPSVSNLTTGTFTVTVTDAANKTVVKSFTVRSCVWPGDTDSSGTVNHFDLLNIGLNYNTFGLARPANLQNTDWYGHFAEYWFKNSGNTGINLKHVDANGDGFISFTDTLAIIKNWEKTHNLAAPKPISTLSVTPPISIETSPVSENKSYAFPIILGDATNMVDAIYGLGFSIGYDANKIVPNSVFMTFEKCWLGKDILIVSKNFNDIGRIEMALVRKNKLNIEGKGQVATLHFTVKKGATSTSNQMAFTIQNSKAIDKDNRIFPLSEKSSISTVTPTQEAGWESRVTIYPNPVQNLIHIESTSVKIKKVEILDYRGVRQIELSEQSPFYKIDMTEFSNSFYIVKVYTDNGVMLKKIIKIN